MTFGQIKTKIETNLLESYKTGDSFKKTIREFKQNILNDKSLSKLYSLYDQLSSPQGLSESDSKDFIQEGVSLIQQILPSVKIPKILSEKVENNYKDIDSLVYNSKVDIKERIQAKKNLISIISSEKPEIKESIKIPVSMMVKIANQKLSSYIETLDESTKKEFFSLISEETEVLQEKYNKVKESAISKLNKMTESEENEELKTKIFETIDKIKIEEFSQLNLIKIKQLEESI